MGKKVPVVGPLATPCAICVLIPLVIAALGCAWLIAGWLERNVGPWGWVVYVIAFNAVLIAVAVRLKQLKESKQSKAQSKKWPPDDKWCSKGP